QPPRFLTVVCREPRDFVISESIEQSPIPTLLHTTPLLEKEWNSCCRTLKPNRFQPRFFHFSRAGSAFTAHDHPVHAGQIEITEILQQRLYSKESRGDGRSTKLGNSRNPVSFVFDPDAPPALREVCERRLRPREPT